MKWWEIVNQEIALWCTDLLGLFLAISSPNDFLLQRLLLQVLSLYSFYAASIRKDAVLFHIAFVAQKKDEPRPHKSVSIYSNFSRFDKTISNNFQN